MIAEVMDGLGVQVILEPGRVIAGNAGVMLTTALYEKPAPDRTFLDPRCRHERPDAPGAL